jgi:hypothetical protein
VKLHRDPIQKRKQQRRKAPPLHQGLADHRSSWQPSVFDWSAYKAVIITHLRDVGWFVRNCPSVRPFVRSPIAHHHKYDSCEEYCIQPSVYKTFSRGRWIDENRSEIVSPGALHACAKTNVFDWVIQIADRRRFANVAPVQQQQHQTLASDATHRMHNM